MKYKKIFKVASQSTIRPNLQYLYVKDGFIYATDSFTAVKLKSEYGSEYTGYITPENATVADQYKKVDVLPELIEMPDQFPEIERVIPEKFEVQVKLNRQYLINVLEAMQKPGKGFDTVTIKIVGNNTNKPLLIENDNGQGFIMPVAY